jgi:predicted ATPase
VAKATNVVEQPGRSLLETLPEYFHDKHLLLVLDNCEHLLGACAQLVEILLQAPEVAILATSREPLDIPGERRYPVAPLSLPPVRAAPPEVTQFEAIQLFAARACAILPGFALTAENSEVIARICRRLDGLPLAIELASARVNVFALEQIEERLADGFAWLASSSRGVEA